MHYILGGGVAGLVSAFYNKEFTVITDKIGGWQNLNKFKIGPRLIEAKAHTGKFLSRLGFENLTTRDVGIGFFYQNKFWPSPTEEFKRAYALKTREIDTHDSSILSSQKTLLHVWDIDYDLVLKKLEESLKDRIIVGKITALDDKTIHLVDGSKFKYEKIINTLPITILQKLLGIELSYDFTAFHTTFFKCEYGSSLEIFNRPSDWEYVYSVDTQFHRINIFENFAVLEAKGNLDCLQDASIKILDRVVLPFVQLKYNHCIGTVDSTIKNVGRFAEWNHKIKLEEVAERFENEI